MNLLSIFDHIEKADPKFADRISPRRAAIKNIASFGSKVTLSSLPFAFGTLFKKAYGQTTPAAVADVLNLLLVMKYLELSFYTKGIDTPNLIPATDLPSIKQIQADETNHIAFLKNLLGAQAQPSPVFDFNPGGTPYTAYASAFTRYVRFLNIAFTFEDLGNRIYQGGIAELTGQPNIQRDLFNIHSVEARHSSHFRFLFSKVRDGGSEAPWVQPPYNSDTNYSFVVPIYYDEENYTQLGISTTEGAFDEYMKPVDAKRILNTFIVSPRYVV
jgi:hypothetical protein